MLPDDSVLAWFVSGHNNPTQPTFTGAGVLVGGTGVLVAVSVGVFVGGTDVSVAVAVGVSVGGTGVLVAVSVGVLVGVDVGVAVGVFVGAEHGFNGEAELRGKGAPVEKSALLLSVSVQPANARKSALVFDGGAAGVVSLQLAVAPYPTKSTTPVDGQDIVKRVALDIKTTFPEVPPMALVPVISAVGKATPQGNVLQLVPAAIFIRKYPPAGIEPFKSVFVQAMPVALVV